MDQMIKKMEQYTNNLENLVSEQTGKLEEEQKHTEQILLELLPKFIFIIYNKLVISFKKLEQLWMNCD